jgi:hypothetical protein
MNSTLESYPTRIDDQPTLASYFNGTHNEKDLIDFVEQKLIEQGKMSRNGAACAYRSQDGCKCAIGVLIPDENYSLGMDNTDGSFDYTTVKDIVFKYYDRLGLPNDAHKNLLKIDFLSQLQWAHDDLAWQEHGHMTNEGVQWSYLPFRAGIKNNLNYVRNKYGIPTNA